MTPWTVACQAPLSVGFSRQEHWSGLPFPFPAVSGGRASQGWCPNVSLLMFWSRNCTPSWEVTAPSLIRIQGPGQSPRPGARRRGTWTLSHALGQVTSLSRKWAPISPRRMRGLDSAKDKIPHSSKHLMCACLLSRFSRVQLFATPWTVACPAPLSMGFSRQEYWSGLPC